MVFSTNYPPYYDKSTDSALDLSQPNKRLRAHERTLSADAAADLRSGYSDFSLSESNNFVYPGKFIIHNHEVVKPTEHHLQVPVPIYPQNGNYGNISQEDITNRLVDNVTS